MARCAVCDHIEGHYSSTTPFVNRSTFSRTRWRPEHNEYQCDDCYQAIATTYPSKPIIEEEGEVEHLLETNETEVIPAEVPPPLSEV